MNRGVLVKAVTVILIALTGITACVVLYGYKRRNLSGVPVVYTYRLTEDGSRVADIPKEEYLYNGVISEGDAVFYAADYGLSATGSGGDNAAAVERAVYAANAAGGGTVYISAGSYKTRGIELLSDVTLYVERGALLEALIYDENKADGGDASPAIVYARGAVNVTVTGGGVIAGRGRTYTKEPVDDGRFIPLAKFNLKTRVLEARYRIREGKDNRRSVLSFEDCGNVRIENIELNESASWTCVLRNCTGVTAENVVIDNNIYVANSDGIDIVGSSDVTVKHCFIVTGDDGVCIKSNSGRAVARVSVSDCKIMSLANCFKIGTETMEDVSDVTVEDCFFFVTEISGGYSGIAIESADGAKISRVSVKNIEMRGVSAPFLIWLGCRFKDTDDKTPGGIDGVVIEGITAVDTELPSAVVGCLYGGKTYKVGSVKLTDITVFYREAEEALNIKTPVPETAMSGYPEITRVSHIYFISHELSVYYDLPAYGLFVRHASEVVAAGMTVTPRKADTRPPVVREDA
ncbi:MAG: right-handed parallel beta-helix repeat-containing protein [Clostridiaceae bacterium]|nr:right-handed parallel beta-helix repeat-containing protein [Clostridiaceae bacterium]